MRNSPGCAGLLSLCKKEKREPWDMIKDEGERQNFLLSAVPGTKLTIGKLRVVSKKIKIEQTAVSEIDTMRQLYRQEMNCQIVHDSHHRRGFTTPYLIRIDGTVAGYAAVTNGSHRAVPAGTLKEIYLYPQYRDADHRIFPLLIAASEATNIETQTNDIFLALLLYDYCQEIVSDTILFDDSFTTHLPIPGDAVFKRGSDWDKDGEWFLEIKGNIVAKGGYLTHYNPPYGDIYMEVEEPHRRRGYGSYIVQELKRICYEEGYRPAARCNAENVASRRTMEKAGLLPCARILKGRIVAAKT